MMRIAFDITYEEFKALLPLAHARGNEDVRGLARDLLITFLWRSDAEIAPIREAKATTRTSEGQDPLRVAGYRKNLSAEEKLKLYTLLVENPPLSTAEIAEEMHISRATVYKYAAALKAGRWP